MKKLLLLTTTLSCLTSICMAQKSFIYGGNNIVSDSHNIYVDANIRANVEHGVFCSLREALEYAQRNAEDTLWTSIYIAPYVYWIDDPDDENIRKPKHGNTPFGMEVNLNKTRLIGLGEQPDDVILASNRGQTQGADGNFTMLHITGSDIEVENITFGNYCNVDLDYRLNPELNRKRRADAIVQAQLIIAQGERYRAKNCRFISRLNLCPFAGPKSVVFDNCYFECTDDALCGTGIYRHCRFTFFSGKPFYSTSRQGAVMMDCDIHTKVHGMQYLTKVSSPVFMIDCRWTSDDPDVKIAWTSVPREDLKCYQSNITLNGRQYMIGVTDQERDTLRHTVDMTALPLLAKFKENDGKYNDQDLPSPLYLDKPVLTYEEDIEDEKTEYLTIKNEDGLEATQTVRHIPAALPRPEISKALSVKRKGNTLHAGYALLLDGHRDASDITWYRRYLSGEEIAVAKSNVKGRILTTYDLQPEDNGCDITARLTPETNRSIWNEKVDYSPTKKSEATVKCAKIKDSSKEKHINIDLSTFPTLLQKRIISGAWTVDAFKPADISEYPWQVDMETRNPWYYSKGVDGAAESEGLIMGTRGARLMYTPLEGRYEDMMLKMELDPCKTAGQGFGSATGQYLDICIKFDTKTMTGYGVRFIRTPYHDKAVEVMLMEYKEGKTRVIGTPKVCHHFRPGCILTLSTHGNVVSATIENASEQCPLTLTETLKQTNSFGGIHIQHTGSIGASAVVIKKMEMKVTRNGR